MLVLHYTGMADADEAIRWLTCAESEVSCHYFIHEDGAIVQLLPEEKRAWHAGLSCWRGHSDINSRSIGIEIANPGHDHGYRPFPPVQMAAVAALCHDVVTRHGIEARNIVAHSDIAPERKMDPGEKFDWRYLAERGVGLWVEPAPVGAGNPVVEPDRSAVRALQAKLAAYGYALPQSGEYDQRTALTVTAFQRHFRQENVDGIADRSTIRTLDRLLQHAAIAF